METSTNINPTLEAAERALNEALRGVARIQIAEAERAATEDRFGDAVSAYTAALRAKQVPPMKSVVNGRERVRALVGRAEARLGIGSDAEQQKAVEDCERAIQLDPKAADAYLVLARIHHEADPSPAGSKEAIRYCKKVLSIDPGNTAAQEMLADEYSSLAEQYEEAGQFDRALAYLKKCEAAGGNLPTDRLATAYLMTGDTEAAETLAREDIEGGSTEGHVILGDCRWVEPDFGSAAGHYRNALNCDPEYGASLLSQPLPESSPSFLRMLCRPVVYLAAITAHPDLSTDSPVREESITLVRMALRACQAAGVGILAEPLEAVCRSLHEA